VLLLKAAPASQATPPHQKAGTVDLPFVLEQMAPVSFCIDADALSPQFIDDDRQLLFFRLRSFGSASMANTGRKIEQE
jgi:hypothetical protein